jgi:hypothetical protein
LAVAGLDAPAAVVVSWLLDDSATLGLLPPLDLLRDENMPRMPPGFFSLLTTLIPSDGVLAASCIVLMSMKACGKTPHLPLELVPDQHQ